MKNLLIILATFAFATATVAGLTEPKQGDRAKDPQKYVLAHSEFPEDGIAQFDCTQCSAQRNTLFIAATKECGNAGCGFFFFERKKGESYKYVTTIFLNHRGFQFLKSVHHGYPDILSYRHMSADEGGLSTMQFDSKEYKSIGKPKTIKSSEFDKYLKPEPVEQIYFSRDLKRIDH